jgi:hypothetical protein
VKLIPSLQRGSMRLRESVARETRTPRFGRRTVASTEATRCATSDPADSLYEILEQRGFEVVLLNARDLDDVRGRKRDVSDCEWLQPLRSVGWSRASFRPAAARLPLRS